MYNLKKILVNKGSNISLKDYDTSYSGEYDKETGKEILRKNVEKLAELQEVLYADGKNALLIILQAPDAAGKDGVIRHVMSGINPQGCTVHSFKSPSKIELEHDYLWRHYIALPARGQIGVFNRSHYENVLITKVHPQYILSENIAGYDSVEKIDNKFWESRYEQINNFEKTISQNGTTILKFFLNISKEEQKERLIARLEDKNKNWKFNSGDLKARDNWDKYQKAYEEMINKTSTDYAPWYIIPADKKYFSRVAISDIIIDKLKSLNLKFPQGESDEELQASKTKLLSE